MSETETVEKEKEIQEVKEANEAKEAEEVKEESQTENFIFEDHGTQIYAQTHGYDVSHSVRVIPRKKDGANEILALSVKEENLDRLAEVLSENGGYKLVTRTINVKSNPAVIIREYKQKLETEFPETDLLKRIESMKKELEASES